jgi:hypothetical protein
VFGNTIENFQGSLFALLRGAYAIHHSNAGQYVFDGLQKQDAPKDCLIIVLFCVAFCALLVQLCDFEFGKRFVW